MYLIDYLSGEDLDPEFLEGDLSSNNLVLYFFGLVLSADLALSSSGSSGILNKGGLSNVN